MEHLDTPESRDVLIRQLQKDSFEFKLKHEHILMHMSDGFVSVDKNFLITDANARWEKNYGKKETILGKSIWDVAPELRDSIVDAELFLAIKTNQVRVFESHNPDLGQWYDVRAIPTPDGLSVFYNEITHRKLNEQRLKESETKFRRLSESNILGIARFASDGQCVEVNDAFLRMLGYSQQDFDQHSKGGIFTSANMTPSEWHERDKKQLHSLSDHGYMKPYEKEFFRKDGTRLPVLIGAAGFCQESLDHMAYVLDLTKRKHSEDRIHVSAEAAGIAFWDWDILRDETEWTNPWPFLSRDRIKSLTATYKASPAQFFSIVHPDDRKLVLENTEKSLFEKTNLQHEFRIFTPDGKMHWVQGYARGYYDKNGNPYRMVGTNIDITDLKNAVQAVRQSETNYKVLAEQLECNKVELEKAVSIRDEFLSVASHELRTPITSLTLQTQILQRLLNSSREALDEDRAKKHLESIHVQVKKLTSLVDDLLDVTRIANGKLILLPEEFDLCELVQATYNSMQEQFRTAKCEVNIISHGSAIGNWDRRKVEQVVVNLLTNACKYGRAKPIRIFVLRTEKMARLIVKDHGIGISQEFQTRIFNRFERAVRGSAFSGLGLGLFISKQIVKAHSGEINVYSKEGEGATFTVDLPLDNPTTKASDRVGA